MKDNLCEICKRPGYIMAYRPNIKLTVCSACDSTIEACKICKGMKEKDAVKYIKAKLIK